MKSNGYWVELSDGNKGNLWQSDPVLHIYFLCHYFYVYFFSSTTRFTDKQIVRLQETPDEIPEGGTPHTVSLLLHDKLVDIGKPGDRVEVRP